MKFGMKSLDTCVGEMGGGTFVCVYACVSVCIWHMRDVLVRVRVGAACEGARAD